MQGICDTDEVGIAANKHPPARDLLDIACGQVAAHFYLARYGTLRSIARALGYGRASKLLDRTRDETYANDREFTRLYEHVVHRPTPSRCPGETALRATAAMRPVLTMAAVVSISVAIAALFSSSRDPGGPNGEL